MEMEEEAENLGKSLDKGIQTIHTERGILKALIQKAFSDAQDGLIAVEARDLIQMMKLQREIEEKSSNVKTEQAEMYLRIFVRAAQNVLNTDNQIRLSNEIGRLREEDDIEDLVEGYIDSRAIEEGGDE